LTANIAFEDGNYTDNTNENTQVGDGYLSDDSEGTVGHDEATAGTIEEFAVLGKLRHLLTKFTSSIKNAEYIRLYQERKGLSPKKVKKDVVTRWWSTFTMIERALELEEALKHLIGVGTVTVDEKLMLTKTDWLILKEIKTVLQPFMEAQKLMEGESYPTSGTVLPAIVFLMEELKVIVKAVAAKK
jgi:hypothetical protein